MKGYKIPIFQRGSLLTQEMLDAMKQYMVEVTTAFYSEYSDGILRGMKVFVSDGIITIGSGLVKYKDALLVITECESVPVLENNEMQLVKLQIKDKEIGTEFEMIEMSLIVDGNTEKKNNEIEICRMQVQNGAKLRNDYRSLEDMATRYDTVQLINADYAAYREKGIHPQILEQFAKEVRESRRKEPEDICFLQQIYGMKGESCNRGLIEFYLSEKLKGKTGGYTNEEIYHGLCTVLRQLKTGAPMRSRVTETRKMIVD